MSFEVKTLKTAIGIPRVRNQMRFHDFSDLNFKEYLVKLEQLLTEVRAQLAEEKLARPERLPFMDESIKRQQYNMNQTFNMTQTSIIGGETPMNKTGFDFTEEIKDTVNQDMTFTPISNKQTVISKWKPASNSFMKQNSSGFNNTMAMRSTHITLGENKNNVFKRGRNSF